MSKDPSHIDLSSLPPLREVIAAHDLRAKKSLGQNFLLDSNITDKIAGLAGDLSGYTVLEVGPGPGGLTRSLLGAGAAKVIAIEYDDKAVQALQGLREAADGRLELHHGDALETDLLSLSVAPRGIIANLPYNVGTPLLFGWLSQLYEDSGHYDFMALMFQREVADRITAAPGTKSYGRVSVMAQWLCYVNRVYDLPPSAFTPPPKVSSAIVLFKPRASVEDRPAFKMMEKILAAAFQQRRKMIRVSLKPYLAAIEACGFDSTLRAESLSVADYVALAHAVQKLSL